MLTAAFQAPAKAPDTIRVVVPPQTLAQQIEKWQELFDPDRLVLLGMQVGAILLLAWMAYRVMVALLHRLERSVAHDDPTTISLHEQRVRTLTGLMRSVGIALIALVALFMVLRAVGLDIAPLLAGAGVIGLAISFGAQSLVKDIISGLFILLENQFGVGDVVRIKDVSGRVETMTLRIVVMRDVQGVVHIIPNGEITQVSNMTRAFSRAVLDIGVAYKEDAEHVIGVLRDVGDGLWHDPRWRPLLVEEVQVPGIESFGESSINIRVVATTIPLKQWDVARELRLRIKRRFDAEGIDIPFPHRTLTWADEQKQREQVTGNREQGTGGREQGTGGREQGTGNREQNA